MRFEVVEALISLLFKCYSLWILLRCIGNILVPVTWDDVDMPKNTLVELEETRHTGTGPRLLS